MSQFDAAARPMFNAFQSKPNFGTYTPLVPDADMKALNVAGTADAKLCETFDFSKEDAIDDIIFNEVIWRLRAWTQSCHAPAGACGLCVSASAQGLTKSFRPSYFVSDFGTGASAPAGGAIPRKCAKIAAVACGVTRSSWTPDRIPGPNTKRGTCVSYS